MYTPSQMRMLRIAVIVMGVILLLGFATVIGRIVYLLNGPPNTAPATSAPVPGVAAPLKLQASIELPTGAIVKHIAISDNRLAVHYDGPSGAGIRIIDLVSPERSMTLPIVDAPTP